MKGLEKELEAKLADPSALSDPRDADFAKKAIKAVCDVRDNLKVRINDKLNVTKVQN